MNNADKLARVQNWIGTNTVGVYSGIETSPWRAPQFEQLALQYASEGVNYAIIKCGEGGVEWYDGTFPDIRAVFLKHGVGCAPYYFNRPTATTADIAICAKLAREAGGIILDCEEPYLNQGGQLRALVDGVRNAAPDAVIIVSGYGDPTYAFGFNWDFSAIANADAYNPQWYLGYWTPYKQHGWQYAFGWADGQCGQAFAHFGLGEDFPIAPAINVQGVNPADLQPMAAFLSAWKAGISVWEMQDITASEVKSLKAGLGSSAPVSTPPTPVPVPPPPQQRVYVVQAGDNLSSIAAKFGLPNWRIIYNANRNIISNPDHIESGWRLVIPS